MNTAQTFRSPAFAYVQSVTGDFSVVSNRIHISSNYMVCMLPQHIKQTWSRGVVLDKEKQNI